MLDEVNRILRERGVLTRDDQIRGITLGPKAASAERIADIIQAALSDPNAHEVTELDD